MFGNRNKVSLEEYQKVRSELRECKRMIADLAEKKELWEEKTSTLLECENQMDAELQQLTHNLKESLNYAQNNVATEETLSENAKACHETLLQSEEESRALFDALQKQKNEWLKLIDQNKHFTSPAKYINEIPAKLEQQNQVYQETVKQMADLGKQMSVLSLQSALEAAKLGTEGTEFLKTAEEVRNYANLYERAAEGLLEEMHQSNEQISEMSEQIHYLISLLKENNIATGKMMKICEEHTKLAEKTAAYQESKVVEEVKEQLKGLYNMEQEFVKCEERNLIQISDVKEELKTQKDNTQELTEEISPLICEMEQYNKR